MLLFNHDRDIMSKYVCVNLEIGIGAGASKMLASYLMCSGNIYTHIEYHLKSYRSI